MASPDSLGGISVNVRLSLELSATPASLLLEAGGAPSSLPKLDQVELST